MSRTFTLLWSIHAAPICCLVEFELPSEYAKYIATYFVMVRVHRISTHHNALKNRYDIVCQETKLNTIPHSILNRKWIFLAWIALIQAISITQSLFVGLYIPTPVGLFVFALIGYLTLELGISTLYLYTSVRVLRLLKHSLNNLASREIARVKYRAFTYINSF